MEYLLFIIFWIFCGIISATIARGRGRSGCGWLILGFIFGPFGFAVALLPKKGTLDDLVKCPFCAEMIKVEAVKCRHCGSEIPVSAQTIISATGKTEEKTSASTVAGIVALAALFCAIAAVFFVIVLQHK